MVPLPDNASAYCDHGIPKDWFRIDTTNPPVFESQCAYLARFGLLLDGEIEKLTLADREPETLPEQFWPRDEGQFD